MMNTKTRRTRICSKGGKTKMQNRGKVYFTFGKENNQEGYGKIEWVDDYRSIE